MEFRFISILFFVSIVFTAGENNAQNIRPIVGILTQKPGRNIIAGDEDKNYQSYVAASYVKFIESGGARVAPIWINQPEEYYDEIASSVNAILFPGGAVSIQNDSGYGLAGQYLYDKVLEKNAEGIYLPLWATCLGFEMLMYLASDYTHWLTACEAENLALPLEFEPGYETSRLFSNMSIEKQDIFATQNVTAHYHQWCYVREDFNNLNLDQDYNILATDHDELGLEFLSIVEHKTLPIFGTQWHPEKNAYEWKNDEGHNAIPHWGDAITATKYFADFFVANARLNNQSFESAEAEEAHLIYGYQPKYVANTTSSFTQVYLFDQLD